MDELETLLAQAEQEIRRGVLLMSVLAVLKKTQYGYSLIQALDAKGITIEGNTLYPMLRRLEKQGLLKSEWQVETNKPRKYYLVTEKGTLLLESLKDTWKQTVSTMHLLLEGKAQ